MYQNETRGNLSESAVDFEHILASVHPIVFGCYSSVSEFGSVTLSYVDTFKNWQNMLVSVVKKGGDLYDVIKYIVDDISGFKGITEEEGYIEFWYKISIYFGLALRMILEHPP